MVRCGVAAVLFGAATPAASRLSERFGSFTLAGLLYLGAALAMAVPAARGMPSVAVFRGGAPRLAVAVVAGGMAGPVLLMEALHRAPSATVSLLLNLEVVFTVLLAGLVFREHLGSRVMAGAAAVAGAGALLGASGHVEVRTGALLAVAACACWAVDNTVTARLTAFSPAQITFAKGVVAGSVNLLIGIGSASSGGWVAIAAALAVGAAGYGLSIMLWITGARDVGAARGQVVFAAAPFVGAALSWSVLGEPVARSAVAAAALTVVGVALVLHSGHDHAHRHTPQSHRHEHVHDDGHHEHVHEDGFTGRHEHEHAHLATEHAHPHVPDLHHRHAHH